MTIYSLDVLLSQFGTSLFILCPVPTVASWPAYRFLRRQVRWFGIPISWRIFQFVVIHTVKGFGVLNKAEIDIFLELSCLFDDPVDVGNLISGSSAFSKSRLNICKFLVHVLLNPCFSYLLLLGEFWALLSVLTWDKCNRKIVWIFFDIAFLRD